VARQVEAGARHVTFGDPDFLNGPGHALAVARALAAAHPGVTFDFTAKVEHLLRHRALLPELAARGALFVVSAFESLSDRVLAILDKGHVAADAREALAVARAAGLSLRPTFVPFTPWTTLEDYRALCRFVIEDDLVDEVDPVQLSLRLLVPPGSLLLEHPEMAPHLLGLDEEMLGWRWRHPDPRVDELGARVAALVERETDRRVAFARILELAGAGVVDIAPPRRAPPPRLTEPWFC
jgi:hypothetical protein